MQVIIISWWESLDKKSSFLFSSSTERVIHFHKLCKYSPSIVHQNSGPLLPCFLELCFALSRRRFSLACSLSSVLSSRSFGTTSASSTISWSRSMASWRFWCCVRCLSLWTHTSPSELILLAKRLINRSFTSDGSHLASCTLKRTSALVLSLLTFCPPTP